MDKDQLIEYVRNKYNAQPEYLWAKYPEYFVLRHKSNKKWFAVTLYVPKNRIGLSGEGGVYMTDVKCDPLMKGSFLKSSGVIPAYHMNKANWIGILLDGTASREDIEVLLDMSYELTK